MFINFDWDITSFYEEKKKKSWAINTQILIHKSYIFNFGMDIDIEIN